MKLSVSNIAWKESDDEIVLSKLVCRGFTGIEVAPTRLIPFKPYKSNAVASSKAASIHDRWGLEVCSLQSLWFGVSNNIFESQEDRDTLYEYTCSAIDFSLATNCKNLVFGSPKNRSMLNSKQDDIAFEFFSECATYAKDRGVVISMEANPAAYGTNFLNTTREAERFVREINSSGLKLNLDIGTMIMNNEDITEIECFFDIINHVHISEPFLEPIKVRKEHQAIKSILRSLQYKGYVSIEMKDNGIDSLYKSIDYVSEVFLDA